MIFRHLQYAISDKDKDRILKQQENHCQWCGFSFDQKLDIDDTVLRLRIVWILDDMGPIASCQFCDGWMRGQDFSTLKEVRDYVREKWTEEVKRLRAGEVYTKPLQKCDGCDRLFTPRKPWQKFCSKECQWKAWDKNNPRIKKTV